MLFAPYTFDFPLKSKGHRGGTSVDSLRLTRMPGEALDRTRDINFLNLKI